MYVVVRRDLPLPQQTVQACHAAIKSSRSFLPETAIVNSPNLVVCTVRDEAELRREIERVIASGIRCCAFQEEDLGGQTTAFATELVSGAERRVFRKLPLLDGVSLAA